MGEGGRRPGEGLRSGRGEGGRQTPPFVTPEIIQINNRQPMKTYLKNLCLLRALLAGLTLAALLHPEPAGATTRTVTSLADNGAGTLRDTVAASAANGTIHLSLNRTVTLHNR